MSSAINNTAKDWLPRFFKKQTDSSDSTTRDRDSFWSYSPTNRWVIPLIFALLSLAMRIPFVVRYDLNFQGDFAIAYLMAKRILVGDLSVYFWNQDRYGTFYQFVTAGFFALFGPSIPVAGLVSALSWTASVAMGIYFVQRYFDLLTAVCAGAALAVAAPYINHYTTQPSDIGYTLPIPTFILLFCWIAHLSERPLRRCHAAALGAVIGFSWYSNKQLIIALATIGLSALLTAQGRALFKRAFKTDLCLIFLLWFIIGYSPEWIYKLQETKTPVGSVKLFGIASLSGIVKNIYWTLRAIPSYFDGDPMARLPDGVHYVSDRHPLTETLPQGVTDYIAISAALITFITMGYYWVRAYREQSFPKLMLAIYPAMVILSVIVADITSWDIYYPARRYMFSCALGLPMWLGISLAFSIRRKLWICAILTGLVMPLSMFHQLRMLKFPDELRDYRAVASDLHANQEHYAISWYAFAYVLTAMTNEDTIFANVDYNSYQPYAQVVFSQSSIALVYPSAITNLPKRVNVAGKNFVQVGEARIHGELAIAHYQLDIRNALSSLIK